MASYIGESPIDFVGLHYSPNASGQTAHPYNYDGWLIGDSLAGSQTDTQPVAEFPVTLGGISRTYGEGVNSMLYGRIYLDPEDIDLGNVIVDQSRTIKVWNAHFFDRPLASIGETNTEGLTLVEPRAAPTTFKPLEELTYTLQIDQDGPPNISAVYVWDFDTEDMSLEVMGSRITAWLWGPNGEILERLEWLTGVLTSYNANEQRQQLRATPRRSFEYDTLIDGSERRLAENVLFGAQGRAYAVPVWFDGDRLQSPVSIGATSITVETEGRDYHAGGIAILTTDSKNYEIVEINTVGADSITLVRPTERAWSALVTRIYPVRIARLASETRLARFTGEAAYGRLRWQCTDISSYTAATETTYRGFPVLDSKPNWNEDITQDYTRKLAVIDALTGPVTYDDESGLPVMVQSHKWSLVDRAEIAAFRQWLYARRGRLSAFWLPSWANDMVMTSDLVNPGTAFDIEWQGYTLQVGRDIGRRDIRIELNSGAVFYRRIINAIETDADTERVTIDTALGINITPSDVRSISWMTLSRLEADAIEMQWWKHDYVDATAMTRSLTNDL